MNERLFVWSIEKFIFTLITNICAVFLLFFFLTCLMYPEAFNPEYKCINNQKHQISEDHKTYMPLIYIESGLPVECNIEKRN